ncbi:MAG: hypothetical protein GC149_18650 [Gammaproteobacteria bacterium]|nr:hypothetical protein [Gammaproteobacteria bacterium]
MVHTSIEHRRVSCRGVLISGCQEPYAQQASNCADWCSRLLKMTDKSKEPAHRADCCDIRYCLTCVYRFTYTGDIRICIGCWCLIFQMGKVIEENKKFTVTGQEGRAKTVKRRL